MTPDEFADLQREKARRLASIDRSLKHLFWLVALIAFCAAFYVDK